MASWSPSWSSTDPPVVRVAMRSPVWDQPGVESSTTQSQPSAARAPAGWHHVGLSLAQAHRVPPCTRSTATSTADATSPSGGKSRARPTTRPAADGVLEGPAPLGVGVGRVALGVAAEEEAGQRRGVEHALHLVDDRQLQPGAGAGGAEAGRDVDRVDDRVGVEEVLDPVRRRAHRHERLDHGHQAVPREGAHGRTAGLERGSGAGLVERDAGEHLAAVEAVGGDRVGVVGGEPVVELEGGALQATTVHRADDDLVVEQAGEQEVLEDVGGAEHPVDPGALQGRREPLEQVRARGHGAGVVADGERPAGRVVGGDERGAGRRRSARCGGGAPPRRRARHPAR